MRLSLARSSVALAALPLLAPAFRHGDRFGDGWRIVGLLMFIIFWVAVIAVAAWALSRIVGTTHRAEKSPLDIARERLARGEISAEEFERIKQQLV